ncbi:MAG TPA: hypothetical protein VF546_16630 [Pyrinomonadaceae bacterium]|jgi:hypothetical protein
MTKKYLFTAICLVVVLWSWAGAVFAQDDTLTYVLDIAKMNLDDDPSERSIDVSFVKSLPGDEALQQVNNWLVMAEDNVTGVIQTLHPVGVKLHPRNEKLVTLQMGVSLGASGIDRTTHKIIIRYQQQNFPTVQLGVLKKKKKAQKVFTAAKGEKDADIYFKGSATGQRRSGPLYSIEAKGGYLQSLGLKGAIGGRATFVSDAGSDVDPDSITASGTYQKVFVINSPLGIILNSDFLGGEFDKKNATRNLTTELDGTLVLPSKRFGEHTFATMDFMAGFEGGHNYEHPLNPKGLGNFWRPKVGVNAYLVALQPKVFNRINVSVSYLLRLPRAAEPFTEKINGAKVTSLTKRPRHYVGIDTQFMFSPAYGLTVGYRYGSLPPDFVFVDHKVTVGFVLQLKQANK